MKVRRVTRQVDVARDGVVLRRIHSECACPVAQDSGAQEWRACMEGRLHASRLLEAQVFAAKKTRAAFKKCLTGLPGVSPSYESLLTCLAPPHVT